MTVELKSEYNRYEGYVINTLTAATGDLEAFMVTPNVVTMKFKDYAHTVTGMVAQDEVSDKSKYWKTDELVKQLEAYAVWLDRQIETYKAGSPTGLKYAADYAAKVSVLRAIVSDLRSGEDIWEV